MQEDVISRMFIRDEKKSLEPIRYPDLIKLQKSYVAEKFGKKPEELDRKEIVLGIIGEIGEIVLNSDFLSWKTSNDRSNVLEENTDILFFVLELYLVYGVESFQEVVDMYLEKRERNLNRRDHKRW